MGHGPQKTLVKNFTMRHFLPRFWHQSKHIRGEPVSPRTPDPDLMTVIKTIVFALALLASPTVSLAAENEPAAAASAVGVEQASATGAEHGIPQKAQPLAGEGGLITNSMLVTWIVALGLIVFARFATRRIQDVPSGAQNFWEWLVESLYDFLEGIIGHDLVKKTFWFFATIFIFILFTNWFGLIPGVGTIGWGTPKEPGSFLLEHASR